MSGSSFSLHPHFWNVSKTSKRVLLQPKHSITTYSHDLEQPWIFAFIAILWGAKFLWLQLRVAFVYEYKYKYLEGSLEPCQLSCTKIADFFPRPKTSPAMGLCLALQYQEWIFCCAAILKLESQLVTSETCIPLLLQWAQVTWQVGIQSTDQLFLQTAITFCFSFHQDVAITTKKDDLEKVLSILFLLLLLSRMLTN